MTGETIRSLTGSFYTPREIVDRMVDSALMTYLQGKSGIDTVKIKALFTYDLVDDTIHPLSLDEKTLLVRLISEMTVLDPACGSGAFPIGALQRILFVLGRLDPEAKIWFENQFKDLSPELKKVVLKELKSENFDYVRKLTAIRSNIFGVDIQPIAAEIAKLRCFLTLVVEQDVHAHEPNRGVHILPNLEFKFVTANSLLSLEKLSEHTFQGSLFGNVEHIEELSGIRNQFFSAISDEKDVLRTEFRRVQANMRRGLTQTRSEVSSKYEKLAEWKPFTLESTNWFDAKWMFGLSGFDAVIANPPYLGDKGHKEIFREIKGGNLGRFYSPKMDLFYYFFHLATDLTTEGGHIAFITTNYYPTATFAGNLRKDMSDRCAPVEFVNFNELRIFEAAPGQHNLITVLRRGEQIEPCRMVTTSAKGVGSQDLLSQVLGGESSEASEDFITSGIFEGEEKYIRFPVAAAGEGILGRMALLEHRLGQVCAVRQGLRANPDKVTDSHLSKFPEIDANKGDGIFVVRDSDIGIYGSGLNSRPYFKNSDIAKFVTSETNEREILYLTDNTIPSKIELKHLGKFRSLLEQRDECKDGRRPWFSLDRPREMSLFEGPKIVCPQRSNLNIFAYNECSWYASADVYFVKKSDDRFPLKAILALLNSRLYYFWLYHRGKRKGEMLELFQVPLSEIPIPDFNVKDANQLSSLVDECIEHASNGKKIDVFEKKIDGLVNKIFQLSQVEIDIIDESYEAALNRNTMSEDSSGD